MASMCGRELATAIAKSDRTLAVYRLQLAIRGWNADGGSALNDIRWALKTVQAAHPGRPVVLVGHSMGARLSLRAADDPGVIGVVGLAPWLPAVEPISQLQGVAVRIIHGANDRIVPERSTESYLGRAIAAGIDLDQVVLEDTGHGMLRRWSEWHECAAEAVADIVDEPRRWSRASNARASAPRRAS